MRVQWTPWAAHDVDPDVSRGGGGWGGAPARGQGLLFPHGPLTNAQDETHLKKFLAVELFY